MIKSIITNLTELKIPCKEVQDINSTSLIIQDLEDTLRNNRYGVGLSANQIGYKYKIAIIKSRYGSINLINPKIIEKNNKTTAIESCLSLPGIKLLVDRYDWIKFENTKEDGTIEIIEAKEIFAIIIQHEIDHLEGKTILDRKHNRR